MPYSRVAGFVQAVHPPGGLRLAGQVERLGDGGLHRRGDLEVGDPCLELAVARVPLQVDAVQLVEEAELAGAGLGRDAPSASPG